MITSIAFLRKEISKKEGQGSSQSFLDIRRKRSEKPLLQGKGATSKVE